ncbi:MAG: NADH-quinone oxidoreductase subunit M [Nitrospirae bacterium]|nr:MAG: NADH-quinone oxidoreductase subunit M [Nitrospirota bacterium]
MILNEIAADQQIGFPILTVLTFLPLAGAVVIWLFQKDEDLIRKSAMAVAGLELFISVVLMWSFTPNSAQIQFAERASWIPAIGVGYHLGVDGISVLFIPLTAFLTALIMVYSWDAERYLLKPYLMSLLGLESMMVGVFASLDLILFFVFWELMLLPSYFLIKLWGPGAQRQYAALKYVLYTLSGSVLMLVGMVLLNLNFHEAAVASRTEPLYSFDFLDLVTVPVPPKKQTLIFFLMFFGFAFKAPIFPFHTWLPTALVEGPIVMSVVLSGVKLGTFGFLRFVIPLLPEASVRWLWVMAGLGLAGILYGAFIALVQSDFRRLLAYASVCHLGFVMLGLFALNFQGLQGSLLQMINLGFTTTGLFFLTGSLISRTGSADLSAYGGLARHLPLLAAFMLFLGLSFIGLPGTNGFVGEFLILLGAFRAHWALAAIGVLGVILGAAYFLWFYERAFFGPSAPGPQAPLRDLQPREWGIAAALSVMVLWIGLYPAPFLDMINGSVQKLVERVEQGSVVKAVRVEANTPPPSPSPSRGEGLGGGGARR